MASFLPGFEYDIFISYRQKDNKGDKWVSRFVDALKTELEATFKEDVSVYFDENPHDRLQETHNVDKSLERKLKCLIFIPILSRTYCDPTSYAWQNEFLTFLKMAEKDSFGKDIRLRSGNVASRILPIRIHDLEQEDIMLFEKETGSVLRAMDFVFKTATGVNRPLQSIEERPGENLNKSLYRDQVNKVANVVKEIILGMQKEPEQDTEEKEKPKETRKRVIGAGQEKHARTGRRKFILIIATVVLLLIIAVYAYPKIFRQNTLEKLRSSGERISVAVMPFQNMTNDTTWNVWQDGIQNILITSLSNNPDELRVLQPESITGLLQSKGINNYASLTTSVAGTISKKLNADVFIYGEIIKSGNILRLSAHLTDTRTGEIIKPFKKEGPAKEDYIINTIDSLSVIITNYLIISKLELEFGKGTTSLVLFSGSTNSPDAYKYFIFGNNAFMKERDFTTARVWYLRALTADSNFIPASNMLLGTYYNQNMFSQAKALCQKNYNKKDKLPLLQQLAINDGYATLFETPKEGIYWLRQMLKIDDQQPMIYYLIGYRYLSLNQYENAILEFNKTLEIYDNWGVKPNWAPLFVQLGSAYHLTGQYDKEKKVYEKAEKYFSDDPAIISRQAILSLSKGDTIAAGKYIEKYTSLRKIASVSEAIMSSEVAAIYSISGVLYKAEKFYRQALSLEPNNSGRMNNLAYFLIDKNLNINEGLQIVDSALKLRPDNYAYLHCKGWGLYKQGKYQEAKDILQKSWDLRMEKAIYNHEAFLHLESAKKAVAGAKTN